MFSPQERVKFFKLAWDALGSEFASRHVQYEMFYAGASFVTRGHAYRTFDWATCKGMVDEADGELSDAEGAEGVDFAQHRAVIARLDRAIQEPPDSRCGKVSETSMARGYWIARSSRAMTARSPG